MPSTRSALIRCFIIAALAAFGCENTAPTVSTSDTENQSFSDWKKIYTTPKVGSDRKAVISGYLKHSFSLRDRKGIYYVHDLQHKCLGFITATGRAFRYVEKDSGEVEAEEAGFVGLDDGVLALLGKTGSVEYVDVLE